MFDVCTFGILYDATLISGQYGTIKNSLLYKIWGRTQITLAVEGGGGGLSNAYATT